MQGVPGEIVRLPGEVYKEAGRAPVMPLQHFVDQYLSPEQKGELYGYLSTVLELQKTPIEARIVVAGY